MCMPACPSCSKFGLPVSVCLLQSNEALHPLTQSLNTVERFTPTTVRHITTCSDTIAKFDCAYNTGEALHPSRKSVFKADTQQSKTDDHVRPDAKAFVDQCSRCGMLERESLLSPGLPLPPFVPPPLVPPPLVPPPLVPPPHEAPLLVPPPLVPAPHEAPPHEATHRAPLHGPLPLTLPAVQVPPIVTPPAILSEFCASCGAADALDIWNASISGKLPDRFTKIIDRGL